MNPVRIGIVGSIILTVMALVFLRALGVTTEDIPGELWLAFGAGWTYYLDRENSNTLTGG